MSVAILANASAWTGFGYCVLHDPMIWIPNVLGDDVIWCDMMMWWCDMMWCGIWWWCDDMMWYDMVRYDMIWYGEIYDIYCVLHDPMIWIPIVLGDDMWWCDIMMWYMMIWWYDDVMIWYVMMWWCDDVIRCDIWCNLIWSNLISHIGICSAAAQLLCYTLYGVHKEKVEVVDKVEEWVSG